MTLKKVLMKFIVNDKLIEHPFITNTSESFVSVKRMEVTLSFMKQINRSS